jgi:hypothetical protein
MNHEGAKNTKEEEGRRRKKIINLSLGRECSIGLGYHLGSSVHI